MSNMSYCRFTNTRGDLQDCLYAIEEHKRLSQSESRAGRNIFCDFLDFCREYGFIEEYDKDAVEELFRTLKESPEEENE